MKKAYSRKGDQGITQNCIGNPLSKSDCRIIALGKIDSLQAAIDLTLLDAPKNAQLLLNMLQKKLGQLGAELAGASRIRSSQHITKKDLTDLERFIDSLGKPPNQFIRFNSLKSIQYNECRVRCRELETYLVPLLKNKWIRPIAYRYINRLSSLFFMLAYQALNKK